MFKEGWYLIYTKPRHEKKLHSCLTSRNIECFLPMRRVVKKWHDRKKVVEEPLFPSYIFAQLNQQKKYYQSIDNNSGFLYFVKNSGVNALIDETTIKNLRIVVDKGTDIVSVSERIQEGKEMVIKKGPLLGLSCQVVKYQGSQKILVKLEVLNRSVLASLPADFL